MKNTDDNANGIGTILIGRVFGNKKLVINGKILEILIKIAVTKMQNVNKIATNWKLVRKIGLIKLNWFFLLNSHWNNKLIWYNTNSFLFLHIISFILV